jgi:hypothetical protein
MKVHPGSMEFTLELWRLSVEALPGTLEANPEAMELALET